MAWAVTGIEGTMDFSQAVKGYVVVNYVGRYGISLWHGSNLSNQSMVVPVIDVIKGGINVRCSVVSYVDMFDVVDSNDGAYDQAVQVSAMANDVSFIPFISVSSFYDVIPTCSHGRRCVIYLTMAPAITVNEDDVCHSICRGYGVQAAVVINRRVISILSARTTGWCPIVPVDYVVISSVTNSVAMAVRIVMVDVPHDVAFAIWGAQAGIFGISRVLVRHKAVI